MAKRMNLFLCFLCALDIAGIHGNEGPREGQVRLVEGTDDKSGLLEIYYHGAWGTICDDHWYDFQAAKIVCQQLGFSNGIPKIGMFYDLDLSESAMESRETVPIHLYDVQCEGNEKTLLECSHVVPDCSYDDVAGVTCLGERTTTTPPPDTTQAMVVKTTPTIGDIPDQEQIKDPEKLSSDLVTIVMLPADDQSSRSGPSTVHELMLNTVFVLVTSFLIVFQRHII